MADKKVPVRLEGMEGTDFTQIFIAVFVIVITLGTFLKCLMLTNIISRNLFP